MYEGPDKERPMPISDIGNGVPRGALVRSELKMFIGALVER